MDDLPNARWAGIPVLRHPSKKIKKKKNREFSFEQGVSAAGYEKGPTQ